MMLLEHVQQACAFFNTFKFFSGVLRYCLLCIHTTTYTYIYDITQSTPYLSVSQEINSLSKYSLLFTTNTELPNLISVVRLYVLYLGCTFNNLYDVKNSSCCTLNLNISMVIS